ncbi:MAG TPA: hypothetical protein PKA10_13025 [Selenomonadales bacterium]|nr:hypothetical protein [Selenomonadales bacterium]
MEHNQPYLQAALLCEGVTTDAEGRHNIHHEFTQYTMGYSQPFTVLTIWRGQEGAEYGAWYKEKTEIVAPDGRVVASGEIGPFSLENSTYRQVNSLLLENVDFTYEGVYELRVSLADSGDNVIHSATYPITVV